MKFSCTRQHVRCLFFYFCHFVYSSGKSDGRSHSFTLLNTLSHTHTDFPNLSKKNILNEMSEISLDKYTWNGVAQLFYCYDKGGSKFIFVLFQIIYLRFVFYSAQILWHSCLPSCVLYIYIYIYIYIYVYEYQIIFAEKKKTTNKFEIECNKRRKKEECARSATNDIFLQFYQSFENNNPFWFTHR